MRNSNDGYQDFFREEIYGGFVRFLLDKLGSAAVNAVLDGDPLFTKSGVHNQLRRQFNEFLSLNPRIEKMYSRNGNKTFMQKNMCNQPCAFPINCEDDNLMVRENIRIPVLIPVETDSEEFYVPRAGKMIKNSCEPFRNQIMKGDWKEDKFLAPKKLIVHFKKQFVYKGKTTEVFDVNSKDDVANILFDLYKGKLASAKCGSQKFQFVKKEVRDEQERSQIPSEVQQ